MQATIGRIQLARMDSWQSTRVSNANKIWNAARQSKGLRVPNIPDHIEHAAYKCYVFVELSQLKEEWSRDRIINEINALGVPCYSGSCSEVYLERAFDNTEFRPQERLLNAKELGETSLMFLVHPTLTEDEIRKTYDAIISVMKLAVN
jgi:dTDP-4-amino-4,6-dideoxygalactose transaminase